MSKKKYSRIGNNKTSIFPYIPIFIAAIIVPIFLRIYKIDYPVDNIPWFQSDSLIIDIYSFGKARLINISGFISLIFISKIISKEKRSFFKDPIIIISSLSMAIIILSSLLSDYSYTSLNGYIERYEGLFVNLSYWTIFVLAYKLPWSRIELNRFFKWFAILNILLGLLGLGQYLGYDLLMNKQFLSLIASFGLTGINFDANSMVNYKVIGQTLYHYNYVSFFISMSLPFFISKALFSIELKHKLLYGMAGLLTIFNLLGSSARGGMVGLAIGIPIWVLFNRKRLFKNTMIFIISIISIAVLFVGFEFISNGFVTMRLLSTFRTPKIETPINRVYTEEENVVVLLDDSKLVIEMNDNKDLSTLNYQFDGENINHLVKFERGATFDHPDLKLISLRLQTSDDNRIYYTLKTDKVEWYFTFEGDELYIQNIYGNLEKVDYFETLGFEGYERIGSARGYIWSRTLPLILSEPLLGFGPDTFPLVFPQQDYIGKYYAYSTSNMIIDKAHNFPLQQAISFGIPYLLLMISLIFLLFRRAFKILAQNNFEFQDEYQSTTLIAIISFLSASMFNDSSVHVSPVFWTLLAISFVVFAKDYNNINIKSK